MKMLEIKSPAFYPYVYPEDAVDAMEYATYYRIGSWDGYLVKLARSIGNSTIYTLDEELRKIKDIVVVNPFPRDLVRQYHEYIKNRLQKNAIKFDRG